MRSTSQPFSGTGHGDRTDLPDAGTELVGFIATARRRAVVAVVVRPGGYGVEAPLRVNHHGTKLLMNEKNENLVFLHLVLRKIQQCKCSNLGIRQPSSSWRTRSVSCSATSESSSKLHQIGEDASEKLDVVLAQFRVLVVRRPKYACRACEDVVVQSPVTGAADRRRPADGSNAVGGAS
jgi:hypothetical protein